MTDTLSAARRIQTLSAFAALALSASAFAATAAEVNIYSSREPQLIEPMLHNYWPTLPGASAATGQMVAGEIRSDLDAKVDELRRHYRLPAGDQPTPASERQPTSSAARQDTLDGLRFLASQPSPTGAITHRPQLGQGTRHATPTVNPHTRPGHSPLRD